jgi:VanZ family protein
MSTTARRIALWASVTAWAAAIFLVSSVPGSRLPGHLPTQAGHLGEYLVMGILLYLALRVDHPAAKALAIAVLLASAYGVTDEFHQRFVAQRTPDVCDWAFDTLGALLGASGAFAVERAMARLRRT